jgi:hypothetical protein
MEVPVSKGFLIFAKNTNVDYVEQACALALSIKYSQTINSVSLVTDDAVPGKYSKFFDNIIPIPFNTDTTSTLATEHRWKLFHASPYNETIVLDADMLLLEDIKTWWDYCANYDLKFCNRIKNYKLETVVDTVHRKTFIANKLTSPYFALHYFKKTNTALEFYKLLEFICNNWEWCWGKFAPEEYQNWPSMDLASAIAIEMMMCQDTVFDQSSPLEFIHMKSPLQGWTVYPEKWTDSVSCVLNSKGDLVVNNIKQGKIFHYVEKDFVTPKLLERLEGLANGQT